jgi:microcystin-dependent protein
MAAPFLCEIRIFSFGFAPKGWAMCNGQQLPISQNQAVFALLGTTYGGDGIRTFNLPNLQGSIPVHPGSNFVLGQTGGEQQHTLSISEMPQHTHVQNAANAASVSLPTGHLPGSATSAPFYDGAPGTTMNPACVTNAGGSQPHENMSPYLVLNFCIAVQGIFPSRN